MKHLLGMILFTLAFATFPAAAQSNPSSSKPTHCSVGREPNAAAQYPDSLKGSGIQGTVLIRAIIGEDGCAQDVTVTRKLHPQLDEIAKETVSSWKFQPAQKDGKPVKVIIQISVEFKENN
jgi:TonB family protein